MFLIVGHSCLNLFLVFVVFTVTCFSSCWVLYGEQVQGGDGPQKSVTLSSFIYATTVLKPYEWRYISVDLPPWFSSVTIALESNVGVDLKRIGKISTLPMICFREGSPPLPDVYDTYLTGLVIDHISNSSFGGSQDLHIVAKCYPMQKSISLMLTNEQIRPGIWYFGLFNGIGPIRTQSKMINRGHSYSFSGNITVEGCTNSAMLGKFCNQTISLLSCSDTYISPESGIANMAPCGGVEESCLDLAGSKVYSLDVVSIAEEIIITALNITFTQSQRSNGTISSSGISLMCYVRHGTLPLPHLYDYSAEINRSPLVIPLPRLGRWYIKIQPANSSESMSAIQEMSTMICYSLKWQVLQCPADKAGLNCTTAKYTLQTFLKRTPYVAFESYYLPISEEVSSGSASFPLGPLLSNSSDGDMRDYTWTFFLLDIPDGAAGGNVHVRIASEAKISGEIYARYGGFPSLRNWDYFYANSTSNSNGSMFFKLYDASDKSVSFYIIYARGGTWNFGLRHPVSNRDSSTVETSMSISLERCPDKCSSHGACKSVLDSSGLTFYSFCDCDRRNGGFDCSVELVSSSGQVLKTHVGQMWQSISLIASNAAALLPAYWALRHKAFAEWILYTSSGISSGLYHACDVGTWCPLSFHVLQFMDFWLSFMAVVSTFVYLSTIDEVKKRTIHTVVAILTALMAESGPTRSSNIILVVTIGTLGLFIGFLIEFFTHHRWISFSTEICLNMLNRWETVKAWIHNIILSLLKRFRWGFLLAGFTALAMAAISWRLETSQNYWKWHSVWHVSIYTSSFLFLCSKATAVNCENEQPPSENYELARQNSFSGSNERGGR